MDRAKELMMEEVTQRRNACFEHPYITMINTLKNNGYCLVGKEWMKEGVQTPFPTALDAYIDYLEMCNSYMKNTEEYSDDEEI